MKVGIQSLDVIAITVNLPNYGWVRGQVGTVVEILAPGIFEIEFSDDQGRTYAQLPLPENWLLVLHRVAARAEGAARIATLALRRDPKTEPDPPNPTGEPYWIYTILHMARLLVLYNQPIDPTAFDRCYFETHVPLAKAIPGLRSFIVNSGAAHLVAGGPLPYMIAELEFDSMACLQDAMGSAEGQATIADVGNFAQAGVTVIAFDTRAI